MYIYVKVVSVERWFGGITKRLSWESSDNKPPWQVENQLIFPTLIHDGRLININQQAFLSINIYTWSFPKAI
jgi:hypothetical protein